MMRANEKTYLNSVTLTPSKIQVINEYGRAPYERQTTSVFNSSDKYEPIGGCIFTCVGFTIDINKETKRRKNDT
ncbi:hypothetical protein DERP_007104 [Dermatophagoides pteronyssinus]|uniref:Uncharacterized protein n=1 Tax=Dermatophagoides pteronyssinus TaxID=6956 RepID=A0ABQ8JU90_DERPT|nr:hypothetical protein DERP_007104 [Dermatophagoides pteronyssinus]